MAARGINRSCTVPIMPSSGALKTSAASQIAWAISGCLRGHAHKARHAA